MGNIVEKLQKILDTKNALKNKINEKGGNITDDTPFANYVNELDNISSGGGSGEEDTTLSKLLDRTITEVVIPSDVTKIGKYAFSECRSLNKATLPNTVTLIDNYAFQYCQNLETINLPNTIISLGVGCFMQCAALKIALDLSNLTRLYEATFFNCREITNVNIGSKITIIDKQVFQYCFALTNLIIPSQIKSIGVQALQIGSIDDKATITFESTTPPTIGTNTFDTAKLQAIRVPMSAVDTYKSYTNWTLFADYIVGY